MSKRKQGGGTLLGLFIGLVIGVLLAAGVVWYLYKTPLPFQDKSGQLADKNGDTHSAVPVEPEPLPGKPGDKVTEKPRFEFYKILPGSQDPVPQPAASTPTPPAATPKTAAAGETLFLQAGAFQKPADADNLKARLALAGIEAAIQQTTLPDKGAMYRVRIGPYTNPDEMAKARSLLAQNGIQASVVRVKDGKDAAN
ncbi:MAG: SPOR domain-containing protein [Zoogloeaceae bacterium]|jgi:cell division protein FtsN|nr:SPOR domain-containing protein [Zoogloeaceae bacterium]